MVRNSLQKRAQLHAALGDQTRLAIAEELRVSDRSPKELMELINVKSNLLAHHLDVLEEAGAIGRSPSAGDARRRYVRLTSAAGRLLGTPPGAPIRDVLFLCTRNSARSQLAAALWKSRTGHVARSAGTKPAAAVNPAAVVAAERVGLSLDGAVPSAIGRVGRGVQVITVCDLVHEELDAPVTWWHWSIAAPSGSGRAQAYHAVVDELNTRMTQLGIPPSRGAKGKDAEQ
ncbi:MAG: helix-turn-helix domain-containing protein [Acidobacteria bacterium]|nr:helix-turn-helix domain-containing protein [Acidobacteriota bacterium]